MAEGRLLDCLRRLHCFGLGLMPMDIRQDSSRHTDAVDAVTTCAAAWAPPCGEAGSREHRELVVWFDKKVDDEEKGDTALPGGDLLY